LYYVTYRITDETLYRLTGERVPGRMFDRGWALVQPGGRDMGGLRAIDAATGNVVWEMKYGGTTSRAGLLVTAADLVFTVDRPGILCALDAKTGEEVWRMRLGGDVTMGPITYLHQGKQQLALIAQGALFVLDLVD
jgi:glucose dehydrogenase